MRLVLIYLVLTCVLTCASFAQSTPTTDSTDAAASIAKSDLPAKKPPEKGHITGQIVNEATGEPLRKATITAYLTDGQNGESVEASTDAAGKFHMDELEAGKYMLNASRNGFVGQSYGAKSSNRPGTVLAVSPGGTIEANFKLTPHSVVTGRIVDEDGDAMANVQVHLSRFQWQNGKRMLIPGESGTTNDLGEYRIFGVAPGKYYLSATYNPGQWNQVKTAGDAPDSAYSPVYYPGTTDSSSATRLEVPKSGHLNGVDFTMQKTKSYRISGRVISSVPGQSKPSGIMLTLEPKSEEQGNTWESNKMSHSDPEGKFAFKGVLPGEYQLSGNTFGDDGVARAHLDVVINHEDLRGVDLILTPGWEMKGTIKVDGDAGGVNLNQIHVMLESEQTGMVFYGPRPHASVRDDGSFTLKDVTGGRYRLRAWSLPEGFYLKSARAGDADLIDKAADFGTLQGAAVEIVISPKGGLVEGSVKDEKGDPVTNGIVVLIPETSKRVNHALFDQASLDQYGHYKMKGITPGTYSLYAFQDVERGIWEDPDFLKTVEKQATDVTIAEGDHKGNDLKVIVGSEN